MVRNVFFTLALVCLPSLAAAAEVPYSGQLSENGNLVTGNRYVALNIYATPTGGAPLQPAQAESLAVVGGVYHTVLSVPNNIWFGGDRWIGVSINGGPEFVPRLKYYAPPRTSPSLVTRFSNSAFVGDQWTKIDSVTVNASVDGFTIISVDGFATQTINPASAMQYAIAETTPAEALSLVTSIPVSATTMPMNATITVAMTSGTHKVYLWGKVLAVGGQYLTGVRHFSALYIPN